MVFRAGGQEAFRNLPPRPPGVPSLARGTQKMLRERRLTGQCPDLPRRACTARKGTLLTGTRARRAAAGASRHLSFLEHAEPRGNGPLGPQHTLPSLLLHTRSSCSSLLTNRRHSSMRMRRHPPGASYLCTCHSPAGRYPLSVQEKHLTPFHRTQGAYRPERPAGRCLSFYRLGTKAKRFVKNQGHASSRAGIETLMCS